MQRYPLSIVVVLAIVAAAATWGLSRVLTTPQAPMGGATRIVSLSPAVTDTLFAIGAGDHVVAITDYCDYPPEALNLPRAGTIITPNYEAIAQLKPGLIIGQTLQKKNADDRLNALAHTELLPWLTLDEICDSIREIGRMTGRTEAANKLADNMHARLGVKPAPNAPRMLLLMPTEPGAPKDVFYIKQNSIHGAALLAAGARNAVERDITGAPTLGPEKLIELDPDGILLLLPDPNLDAAARKAYVDGLKGLPALRAVKSGKVAVLAGPEIYSDGPRVLAFLDKLTAALRELGLTQ
ncbi:MAG: ABC transporter substrate-binding protein [Planctomycetes bacterium]|nr:ABC transporter substrate-binding protein [Planctomycetota bacterium]